MEIYFIPAKEEEIPVPRQADSVPKYDVTIAVNTNATWPSLHCNISDYIDMESTMANPNIWGEMLCHIFPFSYIEYVDLI